MRVVVVTVTMATDRAGAQVSSFSLSLQPYIQELSWCRAILLRKSGSPGMVPCILPMILCLLPLPICLFILALTCDGYDDGGSDEQVQKHGFSSPFFILSLLSSFSLSFLYISLSFLYSLSLFFILSLSFLYSLSLFFILSLSVSLSLYFILSLSPSLSLSTD